MLSKKDKRLIKEVKRYIGIAKANKKGCWFGYWLGFAQGLIVAGYQDGGTSLNLCDRLSNLLDSLMLQDFPRVLP